VRLTTKFIHTHMKGLKSLVIVAAAVFALTATTDSAFAQRHGSGGDNRGGSNGGGGRSLGSSRGFQGSSNRGSSYSGPRNQVSSSHGGLGNNRFNSGNNRLSSRNGRPGYAYNRPGFGDRRPGYINRRPGFGYYRPGFSRVYGPGRYGYYRPHLGFSLRILPFGYYPFFFGSTQFYYSGGLYYRQYNDSYRVVVPPVGAEVPSIPSDADQVTINGQNYYEYKGVYYSAIVNDEGKDVYVIAGKDGVLNTPGDTEDAGPALQVGDEVNVLPEHVREVVLKGEKYFVSEDGVYYEEVISGDKTTYRVVGL
jgi:hypothetical protein